MYTSAIFLSIGDISTHLLEQSAHALISSQILGVWLLSIIIVSEGGIRALRSWDKRFSVQQDVGRNSDQNSDGGGN